MMKYKTVLFDADGTLYDFEKASVEALKSNFEKYSLKWTETTFETYEKVNKKIWNDFEKGLISTTEIKTERFKRFFEVINISGIDPIGFSKDYLNFLSLNNYLLPGAEEIIKWCGKYFKLVIVTNGLASVQNPRLQSSKLRKYFNNVIISEEIGFVKPAKEYFDFVFKQINNPPKEEVVIVGDNLSSDIKGGCDYGIDTCWFNPSKKENDSKIIPTYEIVKLSELKKILAK